MENPRDLVTAHYSLNDRLPGSIQTVLLEKWKKIDVITPGDVMDRDRERKIISQVFKDERVSLHQKEQIALSIIRGEFDVASAPSGNNYGNIVEGETDYDKKRNELKAHINRHNFERPSHLEMIGSTSTILPVVPKDLHEHSQVWKKYFKAPEGYAWGSEFIPAEESPIINLRPKSATAANNALSLSSATMKAKQ